jgi:hypothetical protein
MCRPGLFTVSPCEEEIEGGEQETAEFCKVEVGVRRAGEAWTAGRE